MKKLMLGCGVLRSICAVGMMAFAATAEAATQQVTIDNLVYEVDYIGKTAKLIGDDGHNNPTEINVAEIPWGSFMLPVTEVVDSAFRQSRHLTSVSLPNATTIGANAFGNCKKLTSVSLPKATTIGVSAFCACDTLTSVSLPKATTIGNCAFKDSPSIETVVLSWGLLANPNRVVWGLGDEAILVVPFSKEEIDNIGCKVERVVWMNGENPMDGQDYENGCAYYGITPKSVQAIGGDDIVVKKESIQAAKAETITIADGVVSLAVGVCSNGNFTAETKSWAPVELKQENVEVKDGKIVISIPVGDKSGFMILQSGDAKVSDAAVTHEPWYTPTAED